MSTSARCESCDFRWVEHEGEWCEACVRRKRAKVLSRVKPWMHLTVAKALSGNPAAASVLRPTSENRHDGRRVVDVPELAFGANTEFRLGDGAADDLLALAYTVAVELGRTPITPSGDRDQ